MVFPQEPRKDTWWGWMSRLQLAWSTGAGHASMASRFKNLLLTLIIQMLEKAGWSKAALVLHA